MKKLSIAITLLSLMVWGSVVKAEARQSPSPTYYQPPRAGSAPGTGRRLGSARRSFYPPVAPGGGLQRNLPNNRMRLASNRGSRLRTRGPVPGLLPSNQIRPRRFSYSRSRNLGQFKGRRYKPSRELAGNPPQIARLPLKGDKDKAPRGDQAGRVRAATEIEDNQGKIITPKASVSKIPLDRNPGAMLMASRKNNSSPKEVVLDKKPVGAVAFPKEGKEKTKGVQSSPKKRLPFVPEVAVVLVKDRFYPQRIWLKRGLETRLVFASVNKEPAALIIEHLKVQRWVATVRSVEGKEISPVSDLDDSNLDLTRELVSDRIVEVVVQPTPGAYPFYDVLTGAEGEIVVE